MQEEFLELKSILETLRVDLSIIQNKIEELDLLLHRLDPRLQHVGSYVQRHDRNIQKVKLEFDRLYGEVSNIPRTESAEGFDEID